MILTNEEINMQANITPSYTRKAIKRYEKKVKRMQTSFNLEKPEEAELHRLITEDTEPYSRLVKRLLLKHYQVSESK